MTLQELKTVAQQIQSETTQNSNTAARVGGVLVRIAEELLALITTDKIHDEAITTECIADGAVTRSKIGNSAVQSQHIVNGSITTDKLANLAVTYAKIAASAVTAEKIASAAVTASKIDSNAVTSGKLASNAVTTAKIANNAVTLEKIGTDVINYVSDLMRYADLDTEWEKAYMDESNPDSDYDVTRITGITFTRAKGTTQRIEIPTATMFTDGFMSASQALQLANLAREVANLKSTVDTLQRFLPIPYPGTQL